MKFDLGGPKWTREGLEVLTRVLPVGDVAKVSKALPTQPLEPYARNGSMMTNVYQLTPETSHVSEKSQNIQRVYF